MGKIVKNNFKNSLVILLVLFLTVVWVFSGWPRIWQGPAVPPGIRIVKANPDIEILRPTAYTDAVGETTNPTYAYDTSTTTYASTNAGNSDSYPTITFDTWQSKTQTYTGLVLKVSRSSTGYSNDQWGIKYSTTSGTTWADLDAMSSLNVSEATVSVDLYALYGLLDPANVQVRIDGEKVLGPDGANLYTYDIWTEGTYTANNSPTVSGVSLNGGSNINLTENTTTTVNCTATLSDLDGGTDITSATGTIYRSGVSSSCTADDNNCYKISNCTLGTAVGNDKSATCTADIWFHADPTDVGTYSSDIWSCEVTATDAASAIGSATNTAETIQMNTLLALIITPTINYGTLAGGATSTASEIITATTTGNAAIDVNLSGTDMVSTSTTSTIPASQQQYATSSLPWQDPPVSGATFLATSTQALELGSIKPTSHPSNQLDDIYWRIGIPIGQQFGTYAGTTTIDAIAD